MNVELLATLHLYKVTVKTNKQMVQIVLTDRGQVLESAVYRRLKDAEGNVTLECDETSDISDIIAEAMKVIKGGAYERSYH